MLKPLARGLYYPSASILSQYSTDWKQFHHIVLGTADKPTTFLEGDISQIEERDVLGEAIGRALRAPLLLQQVDFSWKSSTNGHIQCLTCLPRSRSTGLSIP